MGKIYLERWQHIITILVLLVAVGALVIAVWAAWTANDLAERSLDLLPSKHAELKITTPNYPVIPNFDIDSVMSETGFPFSIENMGGQDSGYVKIELEDEMVNGGLIEFQNIEKGEIKLRNIIYFNPNSMENPEANLLDKKTLRIRIRCDRCEKRIRYETFNICIFNQTFKECAEILKIINLKK